MVILVMHLTDLVESALRDSLRCKTCVLMRSVNTCGERRIRHLDSVLLLGALIAFDRAQL